MSTPTRSHDDLFQKIRNLSPERITEVEDFVDFLQQRTDDRELTRVATTLSEGSFEKVWDNSNDADYDRL